MNKKNRKSKIEELLEYDLATDKTKFLRNMWEYCAGLKPFDFMDKNNLKFIQEYGITFVQTQERTPTKREIN